jgi:hypothetical protein
MIAASAAGVDGVMVAHKVTWLWVLLGGGAWVRVFNVVCLNGDRLCFQPGAALGAVRWVVGWGEGSLGNGG